MVKEVNWRVLDWRMMCLKILLLGRKQPVTLKQVTSRKMKLVIFVKKQLIALWNSIDSPYLEIKQVLSVSKRPVTLNVCVPTKLQDVLSNLKWMNVMNVEMHALNKNKTWDLVPLPRGKKVVGCIWVFTLKHKDDGPIDRYKARLVEKGYTQTYGVYYLETFAPVAKLNTVRVLLSLAANYELAFRSKKQKVVSRSSAERVSWDDSMCVRVTMVEKMLRDLGLDPKIHGFVF
ncbi:transposable element gene [Prunus dulcis]|uniref:Transposable element protein n=1 Tax=Prunus dulcis TaxID=3755 RepID=A0A4Y1R3R4_PRUDU|nr:transposable element gene [Prunus dulcis]